MKISFITTVFNEEKTIDRFLDSLFQQTKLPQEIIIVDGGSSDNTVRRIKKHAFGKFSGPWEGRIKKKKISFKIILKKGNRSVGRNAAIEQASGNIIACSDAGNELDKKWLENISKPFKDKHVDVVAGYYKGKAANIFQRCLIPYALVMPDKVDKNHFLPATRSIAFTKSIWKKAGEFNELLSHNEDYAFAKKLEALGANIVFAKDALVYWYPRNTYKEAFIMFYRFALGDAEARILRSNVLLLFARYILGAYLLFLIILYKSLIGLLVLAIILALYVVWSINKNYKYVQDKRGLWILPKLQFTADTAVISGTVYGLYKRIRRFQFRNYISNNKWLFFVVTIYTALLLSTIHWGIPNENRPFPFHMDEWHQLHAVANTFRHGTPNLEGSANGTLLYFLLSGVYVVPFAVLQYVNPFELQIDNPLMRTRIFEVLRLQTILFGIFSTVILYYLVQFFKAPKVLTLLLFVFSPIWLMLSNYFKYDIALLFFILLSLLFLFRYVQNPNALRFILAAIPAGLAIAVKVSAIPLLPLYVIVYFLFGNERVRNIKILLSGLVVFAAVSILFGLPDTLFGKGNILYYLYDNIHQTPTASLGFSLGTHPLFYLFTKQFPIIFGYGLYISTAFALIYWSIIFLRNGLVTSLREYKYEVIIFISLVLFVVSILPLQVYAGGNRSLVLLPFMVVLTAATFREITNHRLRTFVTVSLILVLSAQLYQSFAWLSLKWQKSPHETSSQWIKKNIPSGQVIGIENIPIYQHLPDLAQKEFYFSQYDVKFNSRYEYQVVDEKTESLPEFIILTNEPMERKLMNKSPKTTLANRMQKEGYTQIKSFAPDFTSYKTFGEERDFYLANIVPMPVTVTIYKKEVYAKSE